MAEETWHAARLIPTSGISGAVEQERRGTSAVLAVLASVKEFGRTITGRLGAPAGSIETFIEVPFLLNGSRLYPDGLIRVTRGQRTWVALVEVKTGRNELETKQLENYLDIARDQGFNAVLTVSNQISTAPGVHPTQVDKRKCRKIELRHLSWSQVHTLAVMERINRRVSDPDQAWILSELIRYLEHPKSGALDFDDMGTSWVKVRDAIRAGTLRPGDDGAADVASRWEQLVRYVGMQLGRQLGVEVQPALTRRELAEPAIRLQAQTASLVDAARLSGGLRIPNTVGPVEVSADLRSGDVASAVEIDAPSSGRALTRVNWLLRQLKEAPDDLRIDAFTPWARGANQSELLQNLRNNPKLILDDRKREIRSFKLTLARRAGTKRGQGKGSFVDSVLDVSNTFYVDVVQHLKAWSPAPPKVREPATEESAGPESQDALSSTSLSSQDGSTDDLDGQPSSRQTASDADGVAATPAAPSSKLSGSYPEPRLNESQPSSSSPPEVHG